MATRAAAPAVDAAVEILATPRIVLDAFFNPATLGAWLGTVRSVTLPQALGPYVVEWPTSQERDDVLGRLGGVLRGTVLQVEPTRGFSLVDVFWLPPFGHPVGPMALEITCRLGVTASGEPATRLRVTQSGFEESVRWRRYYEVAQAGWQTSLGSLQALLEKQS